MYRHTTVCLCKPTACSGVLGELCACRKTACLLECIGLSYCQLAGPQRNAHVDQFQSPTRARLQKYTEISRLPDDKLAFVGQFLGYHYKTLFEPIPATSKKSLAIYIQT